MLSYPTRGDPDLGCRRSRKTGKPFLSCEDLGEIVNPPGFSLTFDAGKAAMASVFTGDIAQSLHRYVFDWNIIGLPAGPEGFRIWADTDQMTISTQCKHPQEACEWMTFRSSLELWEAVPDLFLTGSPVRVSAALSPVFRQVMGHIDTQIIFDNFSDYAIPNPAMPRVPHVSDILWTIFNQEADAVIRHEKSISQAIEDATSRIRGLTG